ncbi:MAG: hypothetical protein U0441_00390 [Polyangiaceae bacterium]
MDPRLLLDTDVRAYAVLSARLSEPDSDRTTLLAEHGLDEETWDQLDDAWQERLSAAIDEMGDSEAVPPLVKEHADAFTAEQAVLAAAREPMPFERFIEITQDIRRGHESQHVMKRNATTLQDYLRAQQHWLKRMMDDPDLQTRFHRAMGRPVT